jgi:hypothetical protein
LFLKARNVFYGGIVVFSTAETSSRPDSLARSRAEEAEEEEEEAEEEEILHLEEDFEVLAIFSRNTGRIAKIWQIFLRCSDYQEDPFALLQ